MNQNPNMSSISKFGRLLFSRRALIAILTILLCTAILLAGPLLSFNGWHPLAGITARLALIALLLALIVLRPRQLPTWLFGVVLLILLIWFAGPSLTVGAVRPLAPLATRLFLSGAIAVLAALYGLYLLWRTANVEGSWLWHQSRRVRAVSAPALPEELRLINGIVTHALRQLKQLRVRSRWWQRIFEGKRYLYQLPWYLVLGAPASGKTSVIRNSGLKFSPRGTAAEQDAAAGNATEHCAWWLGNEAVLIDTAGRYTIQPGADDRAASEWRTLLGLLRQHRARAPLNGVLLTVDVAHLLAPDPAARLREAAALRARLVELRQQLGVRLPVYVIVSKLDLLAGFQEYFESLATEDRTQIWGFTLAYQEPGAAGSGHDPIRPRCSEEMATLTKRLEQGVAQRLQEETDLSCRKALYTLPHEFSHIVEPLLDLLDAIFADSKYDTTPLAQNLRGVYLSSAAQPLARAQAEAPTLVQRLLRQTAGGAAATATPASASTGITNGTSDTSGAALVDASNPAPPAGPGTQPDGQAPAVPGPDASRLPRPNHSFFLHGLFARLILNESHLVRPNQRWELRYRVAHGLAHGLTLAACAWLALEITTSFSNNQAYLATVDNKAQELNRLASRLDPEPSRDEAAMLLSAVRELPAYQGLNLSEPAASFRFGLYSAPPIVTASTQTYTRLQDRWLLPSVVAQIESLLAQAVADHDAQLTYDALRVYLMLHEPNRYQAKDVKAVVLRDLRQAGHTHGEDDAAALPAHLEEMLNSGRVLRAAKPLDRQLVTEARQLLGGTTTAQRLYERIKTSLATAAPADFTLIGAVGPQAWTVFRRASGAPLDQGIPGLFTLAGYRDVFMRHLPGLLDGMRHEEAWVMGQTTGGAPQALTEVALKASPSDPLLDDIRSLYLSEYGSHWQSFLEDIHVARIDNRTLVLQTMRTFSTSNSPLLVLVRVAAQQTLLTQAPSNPGDISAGGASSLAAKALDRLGSSTLNQARQAQAMLPNPASNGQERELVDNRFAALHRMVGVAADGASAGAPLLEAITRMIHDYYALLLMSDTAQAGQALPLQADARARLRLAATTSPAPLHNVLTDLLQAGTKTVNQATSSRLRTQQRGVIGDSCTRAIAGKYPFAATANRELSTDEFTRVFAKGGTLDDFFQKNLAAHVDTTARPWRYSAAGPDAQAPQGPSLAPYERAQKIRKIFFHGRDAQQIAWKMDVKVVEMDPAITELILDLDGQRLRYVHGPVRPLRATWPGPRGSMVAQLSAKPAQPVQASLPEVPTGLVASTASTAISTSGPWALLKLLSRGRSVQGAGAEYLVEYDFDGRKAVLEISSDSLPNPQTVNLLRAFRCPVVGS